MADDMEISEEGALSPIRQERLLTRDAFRHLSRVPDELEWFVNISNPRTKKAYEGDLKDFMRFVGIERPEEFREVTRAHVIAWRDELLRRGQSPATLRRKLAALSSMFNYLCEKNAVDLNPTQGVQRMKEDTYEGKTPALSDDQARRLLDAPPEDTRKGQRDRAILATLLYHGLRRQELCDLRVGDIQERSGIKCLYIRGKGGKIRYVPLHHEAVVRLTIHLEAAGLKGDPEKPLFSPLKKSADRALSTTAIYRDVVMYYADRIGLDLNGVCPHALRATAATNALEHGAEITEVQHWLGHARIDTTRLYDKRRQRLESSPTHRVRY